MILLPFAAKCAGIFCHPTSATEYPLTTFYGTNVLHIEFYCYLWQLCTTAKYRITS